MVTKLVSIGTVCRVRESIQRYLKLDSHETCIFDWIFSTFETVLYFMENIDETLIIDDFIVTEEICNEHKIVKHKFSQMISLHDVRKDANLTSEMTSFVEKYNRRLNRFKKMINSESHITFIYLCSNYCASEESGNINLPTKEQILKFFDTIQKLNSSLQFTLQILIPPTDCTYHIHKFKLVEDPNNLKINDHVFVRFLSQNDSALDKRSCIHWNWNIILEQCEKSAISIIAYDRTSDLSHLSIRNRALGASEYQFYSLLEELNISGVNITCQNNRSETESIDGILYKSHNSLEIKNKNSIVLIQRFLPLNVQVIFPTLIKYLWIHDLPDYNIFVGNNFELITYYRKHTNAFKMLLFKLIHDQSIKFITNSEFTQIKFWEFIRSFIQIPDNIITNKSFIIHNILYENEFNKIKVDKIPKKLLFASAWQKGIKSVIQLFRSLIKIDSDLTLTLLSPGYDWHNWSLFAAEIKHEFRDKIIILGPCTKQELCNEIKKSVCVLSAPFLETFGCVFAESLFLGTPVIADKFSGAVHEIIGDDNIVDYNNPRKVYERIQLLSKPGNECKLNEKFLKQFNFNKWYKIFEHPQHIIKQINNFYLRLGKTETTLLFYFWLEEVKGVNYYFEYQTNLINWLYSTSGFYDKLISGSYFDFNAKHCRDSNIYNLYFSSLLENIKGCELILDWHCISPELLVFQEEFISYIKTITKSYSPFNLSFDIIFKLMENNKLLIVNPMSSLMKSQYDSGNINKIYDNFPTIKQIQIYENPYTFLNSGSDDNIFETNNRICEDILQKVKSEELIFDLAIVSAGAYSSLFGSFCFNTLKKDVICIGGDLLSLFGIKTGRTPGGSIDKGWVNVPEHLKPSNYLKIENGCYW